MITADDLINQYKEEFCIDEQEAIPMILSDLKLAETELNQRLMSAPSTSKDEPDEG